VKTRDVDQKARDLLKKENLAPFFTHSLGHGCGVEVHEEPSLNPNSGALLKKGMVVTIEPGIYIEHWGGIRIEDMVLVTDSGPKILTLLDNSLIEL
jgi:Xaa-Pro aminopeptidase